MTQRLIALDRGSLVFDGPPYDFLQESKLIEQLGLEVPAISQLGEVLAKGGLVEPGKVVSLEQLREVLTASEHRKDNEAE